MKISLNLKKIFTGLKYLSVFNLFYTIFVLYLFPTERVSQILNTFIMESLANYGVLMRYKESNFSLLTFALKFKNAQFKFESPLKLSNASNFVSLPLEVFEIYPSFMELIKGHLNLAFVGHQGKGVLNVLIGKSIKDQFIQIKTSSLSLDALKIPKMINIQGDALCDMDASFRFLGDQPFSQLGGAINITIKKVTIPAQSILGFAIEPIAIENIAIAATVANGKIVFSQMKVGRINGSRPEDGKDDVLLNGQGYIRLQDVLEESVLDLNIDMQFSDALLKSLNFLIPLMADAKTSDGTYKYNINGPLHQIVTTPRK